MNRLPPFRAVSRRSANLLRIFCPAFSALFLCGAVATAHDLPSGFTLLDDSPQGLTFRYDAPEWTRRSVDLDGGGRATLLAAPGWTPGEDEGRPAFPAASIPIALPPGGTVRVEIVSERVRSPGSYTAPFGSGRPHAPYNEKGAAGQRPWARVAKPGHVRDQRVASLVIEPVRFVSDTGAKPGTQRRVEELERATIRVTFEGGGEKPPATSGDPLHAESHERRNSALSNREALYRALTVNHETGRAWRAEASGRRGGAGAGANVANVARARALRDGDSFSSSPDWLKLTVSERGMTRVTYQDFLDAGLLNPRNAVGDPRTLRMYTGSARELPESIAVPRPDWMDQTAILVAGGDDGTFDPGDAVEFYALPPDDFADYFDPAAPDPDEWVFHRYADDGVYWLTWGGEFEEPAERMVSVNPAGAGRGSGGNDTRGQEAAAAAHTFRARAHYEENRSFHDETRFGTDLYFYDLLTRSRPDKTYRLAELTHADTASPGLLRVHVIHAVNERTGDNGGSQEVRYTMNEGEPALAQWNSDAIEEGAIVSPILLDSSVTVVNGPNRVRLEALRRADLWLDWIEIFYDRFFEADSGSLAFTLEAGSHALSLGGLSENARVFDVTNRLAPREWTGAAHTEGRLGFTADVSARTHAIALDQGAWPAPAAIELTRPEDLRAEREGAEYVTIAGEFFFEEVETLLRHRGLAYSTLVARVSDIFDVYSFGLRDPVAIRDFLASAYASWDTRPLFVLLAGDATSDIADRLTGVSNRNDLPSFPELDRRGREDFTFRTDDFYSLVHPDTIDDALPDLAIGRLPARNEAELSTMQKKIVAYDIAPPFGAWKNETLVLADDHLKGSSTEGDCAFQGAHTEDSEKIARRLPGSFVKPRIYLTEYEIGNNGEKPEATADLLERMNDGFLVSSYIGNGGFDRMTDENLLSLGALPADGFANEGREYLFTAWTCDVGSFDLLSGESLSERLIAMEAGGALAAYAANACTFGNLSSALAFDFFGALFPAPHQTIALGLAGMIAKANASHSQSFLLNARKYHLLGDPAMELAIPRLAIDLGDTLAFEAGTVSSLAGAIVDESGEVVSSFSGEARVTVHEVSDTSGFRYIDSLCSPSPWPERSVEYTLTGEAVYAATLPVVNGRFATEFVAPLAARTGSLARVSAYASSPALQVDASGGTDSAAITPAPDTFPYDDSDPPRVTLAFASAGGSDPAPITLTTPIEITVRDTSGIDVLQSDPFYQMHARVDGGDPIPLLPFFAVDPASFRTGRARFTLAELAAPATLPLGEHELAFVFADARGNRGETIRRVRVVSDEGTFGFMQDILSYPNPFDPEREESVFYTDFGSIGELTIEIFTVNGRRVRVFRECIAAGAEKLNCAWDGRDADGDLVANGVYVVRAAAVSADGSERDESLGRIVVLRQGDRRIRR
ncbi:MAG: hypothetical protein HKN20_06050 [Gemmatimonadetes bacterium]|nr:hypothetical protein [Gemmatimonadota bacterium]